MDFYDYFQGSQGGFWQWEEQGEVIAMPGGSTIAYREQVVSLLDTLSEQGIPPFGALLMTLMATNDDGLYAAERLDRFWFRDHLPAAHANDITATYAFLNTLAAVQKPYSTGRKKLLLLQALFANSHNSVGIKTAKALISQFKKRQFDPHKLLIAKESVQKLPLIELRVLALLHRQFPTVESILKKIADLPDLPEPLLLDESVPAVPTATDFVQNLLDEPKTFEVGALVRRLWSGLAIPFQNALPSPQPTGGVSDLTNKGDLSRLLVSEFANDDLLFLSRLANNEALYLNREVPPAADNRNRVILIDVSLRNWGTPKTIAFALTVAIARHPKTTARCTAFAVGYECNLLDFSSVDTIIDGLQVLAGCLHPAPGLADYFRNHAPTGTAEVFFVSSPATVRLPAMQQALSQYQAGISYQLLTDSAGTISLYRQQRSGRKHVQDIALPLAELWKNKPATTKPTAATRLPNNRPKLPANYPILFPTDSHGKQLMQTDEGEIFRIGAEKNLFRFYDKTAKRHEKGWQLLYENLPFTAAESEIGQLENGDYVLLLFKTETREIALLNLTSHDLQRTTFPGWKSSLYPRFFFNAPDQAFYFMTSMQHWSIGIGAALTITKYDRGASGDLISRYEARTKRLDDLKPSRWATAGLLKNVNAVYINEANNLVLNTHELQVLNHSVIKFNVTRQPAKRVEATLIDTGAFGFADGSTVQVNRAGMLILTSSNPAIQVMYVPLMLESALGVATETDFAGASYYLLPNLSQRHHPVLTFWQQFIVPFIETITQHGVNP